MGLLVLVVGVRAVEHPGHVGREVIVEVFADTGKVMHHGNADLLQVPCRTDAGEHEKLGRADGARGDDHFARRLDAFDRVAIDDLDALGAAVLHDDAVDRDAGADGEVGLFMAGFR